MTKGWLVSSTIMLNLYSQLTKIVKIKYNKPFCLLGLLNLFSFSVFFNFQIYNSKWRSTMTNRQRNRRTTTQLIILQYEFTSVTQLTCILHCTIVNTNKKWICQFEQMYCTESTNSKQKVRNHQQGYSYYQLNKQDACTFIQLQQYYSS